MSHSDLAVSVSGLEKRYGTLAALAGVSLRCAESLAESLGLAWETRSLTEQDLADADEILLTSTPNCILPATRFNGRGIGTGRPGRIYQSLLAAWSVLAGLDIAAQARARAESTGGSV